MDGLEVPFRNNTVAPLMQDTCVKELARLGWQAEVTVKAIRAAYWHVDTPDDVQYTKFPDIWFDIKAVKGGKVKTGQLAHPSMSLWLPAQVATDIARRFTVQGEK